MTSSSTPSDSAQAASQPGVSPFLTANEVAPLLRVRGVDVARLCREGRLRATRPGKTWLILPEDVDAYIAAGYNDAERTA